MSDLFDTLTYAICMLNSDLAKMQVQIKKLPMVAVAADLKYLYSSKYRNKFVKV